MNILILGIDEPFYSRKLYTELADLLYKNGHNVKHFYNIPGTLNKKRISAELKVYGLVRFVLRGAKYLLSKLRKPSYQVFSDRGIPVHTVDDLNDAKFINEIKRQKPDITLSINTPKRFSKGLISVSGNIINVHFGMLPKYRGLYPIYWALKNNEKQIGITVHKVDPDIDCGSIVQQDTINVEGRDIAKLYEEAFSILPYTILRAITKIEQGSKHKQNDDSKSSYYSYPKLAAKDKILFFLEIFASALIFLIIFLLIFLI